MRKRFLSILLALIMVMSLFPLGAMAAEETPNPNPDAFHEDGLYLKKSFDPDTFTLTLESYAEGATSIIHSETTVPCDIVLVLDQSGSMSYSLSGRDNNSYERMNALKDAVSAFISTIQRNAAEKGVDHRVAVVGFASDRSNYNYSRWENTELLSTTNVVPYASGNTSTSSITASQYQDALVSVNVDGSVNPRLTTAVERIDAEGGTYTEYGYLMAKGIFDNNPATYTDGDVTGTRNRVVVLFTDGDTDSNENQVIRDAVVLQENYDATIYSVGFGTGLNTDFLVAASSDLLYNYEIVYANDLDTSKTYTYYEDGNGFTTCNYEWHLFVGWRWRTGFLNYAEPRTSLDDTNPDHSFFYNKIKNPTENKYFKTATETDDLTEIFVDIAEDTISGGSSVTLDAETVIKDVMQPGAFLLDGVTASDVSKIKAYTVPCTAVTNGECTFDENARTEIDVDVDVTGQTVDVSGFNFAENWCGPDATSASGVHGNKLIIEIPVKPAAGATGVVYTNDETSGIYDGDTLVKPFPQPSFKMKTVTNIVDFNAWMKLATGVTKDILEPENDAPNGEFDVNGSSELVYRLNTESQRNDSYKAVINKEYSTVDVVTACGVPVGSPTGTKATWATYNVIPGSSVYYDDQLANATVTVGDGSGYNAQIVGGEDDTDSTGAALIEPTASGNYHFLYFTFYGKGIDIYCTTDSDSQYVTASIFETDDPSQCGSATRVKNLVTDTTQQTTMRNYSDTTRYNVPSLSFECKDVGTYTVRINVLNYAHYQLDGVRVYNPTSDTLLNSTDESKIEAQALFIDLHNTLLNAESEYTALDGDFDYNGDYGETAAEEACGILYIDGVDDIVMTTVDEEGNKIPLYDPQTGDQLYQTNYDFYKSNGPKNEIYLSAGQAVAFKLQNWSAIKDDAKFWIGVSAPENGSGFFNVNNAKGEDNLEKKEPVNSYVDMYYRIYPNSQGVVQIKNAGSSVIALTNLKVTNVSEADLLGQNVVENLGKGLLTMNTARRMAFAPVTTSVIEEIATVSAVSDGQTPGTTDDEPTVPSVRDIVHQLISSFIRGLFDSVSRLFNF